jgi:hypothetical protein
MDTPLPRLSPAWQVAPMLALVCWLTLAPSGRAAEPAVTWRDGRREHAELSGFAPDNLRFRIGSAERAVPAADIIAWGRLREPPRGPAFLLRSGSLIVVEDWNVVQDRVRGEAFWLTELAVEKRFLRATILGWSTDAMAHDRELRTWLATSPPQTPLLARDQLLLESGDTVSGGVLGWDEASGDEPRRLRLRLARGETRIPADAIRAILWSQAAAPSSATALPPASTPAELSPLEKTTAANASPLTARPPAAAAASDAPISWILGLRDGSLLRCDRMETEATPSTASGKSTGASQLVLKLRDGIDLICDAAALREELVFVQPLPARVRYLSDMDTTSYKHVPLFSQPWGFQRDASASGGALRCDGQRYPKGLGMHATSRLAFTLAEPHQRFRALLGIDDAAARRGAGNPTAGNRGSVIFRVYVDRGTGKWEPAFASGVVRGGDKPVSLDLDIAGVRGLALIVDAADHGDQGDLANWLDARLE